MLVSSWRVLQYKVTYIKIQEINNLGLGAHNIVNIFNSVTTAPLNWSLSCVISRQMVWCAERLWGSSGCVWRHLNTLHLASFGVLASMVVHLLCRCPLWPGKSLCILCSQSRRLVVRSQQITTLWHQVEEHIWLQYLLPQLFSGWREYSHPLALGQCCLIQGHHLSNLFFTHTYSFHYPLCKPSWVGDDQTDER